MLQQGKINRDDMLELTRRMTLNRNCFSRIAGAYFDEGGFVNGTFNKHFQRLTAKEQQDNLKLAKAIPFSETNTELKEYVFDAEDEQTGGVWQLLMALKQCELKNDALLDVLYEIVGEKYPSNRDFAFYVFYGNYDIPLKAQDKESLWESEEVYSFMVCAVCPVDKNYEPDQPIAGFLFPAFKDRSSDYHRIAIFQKEGEQIGKIFM